MMRNWQWFAMLLTIIMLGAASGCGGQTKVIPVKEPPALEKAKGILQNYVQGQPMMSEASTFPDLVDQVRKTDPAKADILKKGFDDLQKAGGGLAEKAKEILGKL